MRRLSFIIILGCILRVVCSTGMVGRDDLEYNGNGYMIFNGAYKLVAHPFSNRLGLIIPVAVCFKIFGVDEISSILYPFIQCSGCYIKEKYLGLRYSRTVISQLLYTILISYEDLFHH